MQKHNHIYNSSRHESLNVYCVEELTSLHYLCIDFTQLFETADTFFLLVVGMLLIRITDEPSSICFLLELQHKSPQDHDQRTKTQMFMKKLCI